MLVLTPYQERVLDFIRKGKYQSVRQASRELGISHKTVHQAVTVLKRLKVVKPGPRLISHIRFIQ